MFEPRIFDYFPERPFVDWAQDVFPVLLEHDVPFHIHEVREYWNDVGSLAELRQGTFDALRGELRLEVSGEEIRPGVTVAGSAVREDTEIEAPAWLGRDVRLGAGVRMMGPMVVGDGVSVGAGAELRGCIIFPGTEIPGGRDPDRRRSSGTRASSRACATTGIARPARARSAPRSLLRRLRRSARSVRDAAAPARTPRARE